MKQYIKKEEKRFALTLENFGMILRRKAEFTPLTFVKKVWGFTLIEAMVSIMIVMLVVTAVTFAVRTSVIISSEAKYSMEAQFLAKEAIEYVQNMRNTQILKHIKDPLITEWLGELDNMCSQKFPDGVSPKPCTIDLADMSVVGSDYDVSVAVCDTGVDGCPLMRYNTQTYRYGYGSGVDWIDTSYTREVIITDPNTGGSVDDANIEALVTVRVYWEGRTGKKQIVYQESLFNWIN